MRHLPLYPLVVGLLLGMAACAGPLSVHDPRAVPDEIRAAARAHLADPERAPAAHRDLAWLCLLHRVDCEELAQHGQQQLPATTLTQPGPKLLEAALLRAIALDGQADVRQRAHAWLDVAVVATAPVRQQVVLTDLTLTAAARQWALLSAADSALVAEVARQRPDDLQRLTGHGSALGRWLRAQWLGPTWPRDAVAAESPMIAAVRVQKPLTLRWQPTPLAKRLHLGMAKLQQGADLAAVATPDVELPMTVEARSVPMALATGHYVVPVPAGGVYRLQATSEQTLAQPHWLVVRAPRGAKVWRTAPQTGLPSGPPQEPVGKLASGALVYAVAPGTQQLALAVALYPGDPPLDVALLPADAPNLALWWQHAPAKWPAALRQALPTAVLHWLLAQAGAVRAPRQATAKQAPLQALLDHQLAQSVPLPGMTRDPVEQHLLDAVLAVFPDHVEARLGTIARLLDDGSAEQAEPWLRGLMGPTDVEARKSTGMRVRLDVQRTQAAVRHAQGLSDLAAQALAAARTHAPQDCHLQADALQLGLDSMQRPMLRDWLTDRDHCPTLLPLHAQALALTGSVAAATGMWQTALLVPQWSGLAAGQLADRGLPANQPAWAGNTDQAQWQALQQQWTTATPAERQQALTRLLLAPDTSLSLRQRALAAGAVAPWQRFLRDGLQVAEQADDPALMAGARTAWLLDQELVVLLPGGGAIRRVHQVLRVLSPDAAEEVGEVAVPDGAVLEVARTILADGTVVQPAETADKASISLRMVEAGSAVEFAQVAFVSPDDEATGATRLPQFLFQTTDAPVRLSEYAVLAPPGVTPQRFLNDKMNRTEIHTLADGWTAWVWRTANQPPQPAEPRSVRPELAVPAVQVSVGNTWAAATDPWNDLLQGWLAQASGPLQSWLQASQSFGPTVAGLQKTAARLSRLVEDNQEGSDPVAPAQTARDNKGDRATLFWWLMRSQGLHACLVRVAPLARLPLSNRSDPANYSMLLVRVRTATGVHWYDPGLDGGLVNHVRAGLRGMSGLLVGCPDLPQSDLDRMVVVPHLGAGKDLRQLRATVLWSADGAVVVKVRDVLHGALAGAVRQFFWQGNKARYSELVRDLTADSFGPLDGELQQVTGIGDLGGPLTLEYTLTGKAEATRTNQLDIGLLPAALGQTYATLPERKTHLLFAFGAEQDLEITVESPVPLLTSTGVQTGYSGPIDWQVSWQPGNRGQMVLRKKLTSTPDVIEPDKYPALAKTLRTLDSAERVRLSR